MITMDGRSTRAERRETNVRASATELSSAAALTEAAATLYHSPSHPLPDRLALSEQTTGSVKGDDLEERTGGRKCGGRVQSGWEQRREKKREEMQRLGTH